MNISITVNLKIGLSEQQQEIFIDGDAIISHVRRPFAMLCMLECQHIPKSGVDTRVHHDFGAASLFSSLTPPFDYPSWMIRNLRIDIAELYFQAPKIVSIIHDGNWIPLRNL